MAEFNYVSKNERKQAKLDLIELIKCVQDEVREYFTFRFDFIGSEPLNMVTRDLNSNIGYDFDVNIEVNNKDDIYSAEEIKRIIRLAFDEYNRYFDYDYCEDSSRVLTIKVKDRENSRIIHSCDFAIVYNLNDGRQKYIRYIKKQERYVWEFQPKGYYKQSEKIKKLKQNNKFWEDVRTVYLKKKNNNINPTKKSRHLRAEAINEVYQRYFA
ncbi:MAG: hypothetical protein IJW28_02105 [Clostridia bacterium]|nr:hypothetical protein [Clostridia bacterium]